MKRQAEALIHLDALRHNLRRVKDFAPHSRVFAAIKADAYGHGATHVARALAAADGYAVASLDEALQLRWSGVAAQPIMLLSEPPSAEILDVCSEQQLQPVVFDAAHLPVLTQYSGPPIQVWIKLDTGMHRLGMAVADAPAIHAALQNNPKLSIAGWLTHLACADDVHSDFSARQARVFDDALQGLPGARSIANSAGIVAWPDCHRDVVRPGIMLYGGSPLLDKSAVDLELRPAMTLRAPLLSVRDIAAGEAVGYGGAWRAPQATRLGVVAIGYGDGYPRHVSENTPVLFKGRRVPIVGRVSMDMITVDLGAGAQAAPGDAAVLWGQGLDADEIARCAGTIAYELFCQLTARVAFRYCE